MHDDPVAAEIKAGLPDDLILWIDRPNLIRFIGSEISHSLGTVGIFALVAGVPILLIFVDVVSNFGDEIVPFIGKPILSALVVITIAWIVVSLSWILITAIRGLINGHRTVYAITNKRLVILMLPWLGLSRSVRYYAPNKIRYLKRTSNSKGVGKLEFAREAYYSRDKRHHRWVARYKKIGFWGIANVKMVEDTIRYQFHIQ